jgi:hypothetical protein
MAGEDKQVRRALNDLKTLLGPTSNADLNKAQSCYTRFSKIRTEILELSRQNTNVRSLSVSLNQKHKTTLLCQDALSELKRAIQEEPVRGVTYGPPARPR